jgi:hypothetical protein
LLLTVFPGTGMRSRAVCGDTCCAAAPAPAASIGLRSQPTKVARKNAEVAIRSPFAVLGKRIVALAGENGASEPEINQSISEKVESGFPSENATDATMLERFLFPVS